METLIRVNLDFANVARLKEALDIDEKRRGDKVPTDKQFTAFVNRARRGVEELGERLANFELTQKEYIEALTNLLHKGHAEAAFMGRQLGGDLSPFELDDERWADLVMRGEADFLAGFLADLDSGRYTDFEEQVYKTAQINARGKLYTGKFRGTANETFVVTSEPDDSFMWHQLTIEPCVDCPRLEAGSPYLASSLPSYPGDGKTQCRTNCGCVLVRQKDGRFGFTRSYE